MQGTMSPKGAKGQNSTIGTKYYCSFCTCVPSYFTELRTELKIVLYSLEVQGGVIAITLLPAFIVLASLGRGGINIIVRRCCKK